MRKTMKCPNCGRMFDPNTGKNYCPECGSVLWSTKFVRSGTQNIK